jgi:peptide/nickel transport system substrate-binding protein
MLLRKHLIAVTAALSMQAAVLPVNAITLRYANQSELKSLDPYTLNETTTNAHLGHVYEGLTRRGKDLKVIPGLAERWEVLDGATRWRLYLRQGVKFHNGEDFTVDDVIFSAERVRAAGSNFQTRVPKTAKFIKIDEHTLDMVLESPDPIANAQWDTWYIMSKKWAEAHNAIVPTPASAATPGYASLNTNGTGPFKIETHQPGVRTVFKVNPNWWDKKEHNLDEIIFTPIPNDATRVAALLSGEVDVIEPVPVQDISRIDTSADTRVLAGPELRTIYLGYDQLRDELLESNVKGKNPFKDVRVREAFNTAIDKDAIKRSVMRNFATPSAIMIAPALFAQTNEVQGVKFDPDHAKKRLAEAGYPNGFEVGMDCPNDRYVNDGAICQAIVGMLARIGVKVNLNAQPKAQFFAKVLKPGGYKTSFYLLGWTPPTFDSHNVLHDLHGCRSDGSPRGETNVGGYCNKKVDELTDKILVEADPAKRDTLIKEAFQITTSEFAFVPLHQQSLSWGVRRNLTLPQRPDNSVILYWAYKN